MSVKAAATERHVRTARAAAILRVSTRTVTVWAEKGWLPHSLTIGGQRRYPEAALREIAEAMECPAGEPGEREERSA
jgi:predicted site-specific integrase-resolvase